MSSRAFAIVAFVLACSLALTDAAHGDPYNICDIDCVQDIYDTYCGGTPCVYGAVDDDQRAALCTRRCIDAITGRSMNRCLKSFDPLREDFQQIQNLFASFATTFCEENGDDIDGPGLDEGSAPGSVPAPSYY